jgi:hypothetical protein
MTQLKQIDQIGAVDVSPSEVNELNHTLDNWEVKFKFDLCCFVKPEKCFEVATGLN